MTSVALGAVISARILGCLIVALPWPRHRILHAVT